MSIESRIARLEDAARRKCRPVWPLVVCVYPDECAGHPNLNDTNMTESQAVAFRKQLAERGERAGPLFIRWDSCAHLDL